MSSLELRDELLPLAVERLRDAALVLELDALRLVVGGPAGAYVVLFAAYCAVLEIFSTYERYVRILKWMTLSLFAYVAVLFLLTLFLAPLAHSVPVYATAPALLFVACMMARGFAELDWEDVTE